MNLERTTDKEQESELAFKQEIDTNSELEVAVDQTNQPVSQESDLESLKAVEQTLQAETGITRNILQRIRDNPTLQKVFNVVALSVGLFLGTSEAEAQILDQVSGPDKKTEVQEFKASERLKNELERIPLYHELIEKKGLNIRIIEDSSLYDQGRYAVFQPVINTFRYEGTIRVTPYEKLSPEDTSAYRSSVFHELVHAEQEYELWQYFFAKKKENTLPEWKMKYYYAHTDDGTRLHIGAELDANYRQAMFEQQTAGKIEESTLAGFFVNYMAIQQTEAYGIAEVKELADKQYQDLAKTSGYTLDLFIQRHQK